MGNVIIPKGQRNIIDSLQQKKEGPKSTEKTENNSCLGPSELRTEVGLALGELLPSDSVITSTDKGEIVITINGNIGLSPAVCALNIKDTGSVFESCFIKDSQQEMYRSSGPNQQRCLRFSSEEVAEAVAIIKEANKCPKNEDGKPVNKSSEEKVRVSPEIAEAGVPPEVSKAAQKAFQTSSELFGADESLKGVRALSRESLKILLREPMPKWLDFDIDAIRKEQAQELGLPDDASFEDIKKASQAK